MTDSNWSSLATCPENPKHQTSIVVTDGKVDASELRYKEENELDLRAKALRHHCRDTRRPLQLLKII